MKNLSVGELVSIEGMFEINEITETKAGRQCKMTSKVGGDYYYISISDNLLCPAPKEEVKDDTGKD